MALMNPRSTESNVRPSPGSELQLKAALLVLELDGERVGHGSRCGVSLTIQSRATPTGEWLRKLDNRCITQTIHKLKEQPPLAPARC